MNYLGVNIKKIRERWGLSQAEFGVLIDASRGMIMQYERRGTTPKNETVSKIMKVTGLTRDMLFDSELPNDLMPEMSMTDQTKVLRYRTDPDSFEAGFLSEEDLKALEKVRGHDNTESVYQEKYLEQVELRLKDLERDKEFLQRMLELNSGKASVMLQTIMKFQTAHDEVIMKALDRLEKKPEGTLSEEADRLETEINQRLENFEDVDKRVPSRK